MYNNLDDNYAPVMQNKIINVHTVGKNSEKQMCKSYVTT